MHVFSPENAYKLELPWRYEVLPPETVLKELGCREGMTVVDVGAGTGFFTRAAAVIVGPAGRVIATDISGRMLHMLREHGVPENVELLQTSPIAIPLSDAVADIVLAAFVVHEASDTMAFVKELLRLLKPDGVLTILEWKKQEEEHGPPMDERISAEDLRRAVVGYDIADEAELNGSHYYIRIRKP